MNLFLRGLGDFLQPRAWKVCFDSSGCAQVGRVRPGLCRGPSQADVPPSGSPVGGLRVLMNEWQLPALGASWGEAGG